VARMSYLRLLVTEAPIVAYWPFSGDGEQKNAKVYRDAIALVSLSVVVKSGMLNSCRDQ
jgi:hypothetical protein